MTVIVIRHANDDGYDQKYKHDQKITKEGKKSASKLSKKLIRKYGNPDEIVYGPMIRTRQTTLYMLKEIDSNVIVKRDNRLSRYFTREEQKKPSVSPHTLKNDTPIHETHTDFKKRCKTFTDEKVKPNMKTSKIVWVITHTLVIKQVMRNLNREPDLYLPFLANYVLK